MRRYHVHQSQCGVRSTQHNDHERGPTGTDYYSWIRVRSSVIYSCDYSWVMLTRLMLDVLEGTLRQADCLAQTAQPVEAEVAYHRDHSHSLVPPQYHRALLRLQH